MHFSKASTYGIRAIAYIVAQNEKAIIPVRELGNELNIPATFLTKVMQRLAGADIVRTIRGFGGGVSLKRPADEITLKEVILAIDGDDAFEQYWLGIAQDHMQQIPEFHDKWKQLNRTLDHFFSSTRMVELNPEQNSRPSKQTEKTNNSRQTLL